MGSLETLVLEFAWMSTGSTCCSGSQFLYLENESLIGMRAMGISGPGLRQGMTQLVSPWASVPWPDQHGALTVGAEEGGDIGFEPRSFSREVVFIPELTNTESEMRACSGGFTAN